MEGWKVRAVTWGQAQRHKADHAKMRRPLAPKQGGKVKTWKVKYQVCTGKERASTDKRYANTYGKITIATRRAKPAHCVNGEGGEKHPVTHTLRKEKRKATQDQEAAGTGLAP